MRLKRAKELSAEQTLMYAFEKCSPKHFREIKHFHPEGKSMPNGVAFQRGGYIQECLENAQSFVFDEGVHDKQYELKDHRGGIIVFPTDVNVLNGEEGPEKYKKTLSNLFNNNHGKQFYSYSVGHAFRGKYQSDDGKLFDRKSVTFEINGTSCKSLLKLAELVAKIFDQKTVLVKDLNNNKIYIADAIPVDIGSDDAGAVSYENQRIYVAPLVKVKDIGPRFRRHHPNGYIILNRGTGASKLRDQLKTDGYTFSLIARGYVENRRLILEHSFVVFVDKIDMSQRGKVNAKEHQYKCSFEELLEYGKRLCAKEEFDQEVFSAKFPNDGDAVWMDPKGEIVMKFEDANDLRFFAPSSPQRISSEVSFYKYEFPCCREYRFIAEMDGVVGW